MNLCTVFARAVANCGRLALVALGGAVLAAPLVAQPRAGLAPEIGYIYPAGGQQGTLFKVTIGGQHLEAVNEALFSLPFIHVRVLNYERPPTQKELMEWRDQLQALMEKRAAAMRPEPKAGEAKQAPDEGQKPAGAETKKTIQGKKNAGASNAKAAAGEGKQSAPAVKPVWTPDDQAMVDELRRKAQMLPINRHPNPAISETVTLEIDLPPDAPPGMHELRLQTPTGISNPMVFCVGQLPEFTADKGQNRYNRRSAPNEPRPASESKPIQITLPAVVNGQVMPGEVDRIHFQAQKGQRLVVAMQARALIPYLADAVPGWFQSTLALFDAKGHELAYDDDFRFNPDPVLAYEIRETGEYTIEVKDSIYRGREDFVYRLEVGELPFVTSIYPLGAAAGVRTTFEVRGWNLPTNQLTMDNTGKSPGTYLLSLRKDKILSNSVPFAIGATPEVEEHKPNDSIEKAQPVTLPVVVNGRIERPGEWDVYRIEGQAGQELVAEVFARRLNSPLDSYLKLTDATGQQLAFNDDHEDKGSGLTTHHADSRLSFKLPADGPYFVHISDAQHQGGPEYGYRLHLHLPQPDFDLRVVPASINIRGGASTVLTMYALRKDGFAGEIDLALKDTSPAFSLSGARVPAGQDKIRLTLTAPASPNSTPFNIHLEGQATIDGKPVVHPAVPAEDMMQAFAYRHLVTAKELKVDVSGRFAPRGAIKLLDAVPLKIPAGGTARIKVSVPAENQLGRTQLELSEPPEGIAIKSTAASGPGAMEIVFTCDAAKAKPGLVGNLIVTAAVDRAAKNKTVKAAAPQRTNPIAIPAIPFEVVAR